MRLSFPGKRTRHFVAYVALCTLAGGYYIKDRPIVNKLKGIITRKTGITFPSPQTQYNLPTAAEQGGVLPFAKKVVTNNRADIESKIAEIIVASSTNTGSYIPGGILLSGDETRDGHVLGTYSSYDPVRTQTSVQAVLEKATHSHQRTLIFEEGEGGYVMGVGNLPAASQIGHYYATGIIDEMMRGRVRPSKSKNARIAKKERLTQVRNLFEEYATELQMRHIDVVFGPVLDVVVDPKSANPLKAAERIFSNNHEDVRTLAKAYAQAMHAHGIRTTGKHFLGAGLADEGDLHLQEVPVPKETRPRVLAGRTYHVLKNDLDAVMVTHNGNPLEDYRPYTISSRALNFLTKDQYVGNNRKKYPGIGFQGLVITDDIAMRGLLDYVEKMQLTPHEQLLTNGCTTSDAKASVLALHAGVHALILTNSSLKPVIEGIKYAYAVDGDFRQQVNAAIAKWDYFAQRPQ